jgi:hypothetical protein
MLRRAPSGSGSRTGIPRGCRGAWPGLLGDCDRLHWHGRRARRPVIPAADSRQAPGEPSVMMASPPDSLPAGSAAESDANCGLLGNATDKTGGVADGRTEQGGRYD